MKNKSIVNSGYISSAIIAIAFYCLIGVITSIIFAVLAGGLNGNLEYFVIFSPIILYLILLLCVLEDSTRAPGKIYNSYTFWFIILWGMSPIWGNLISIILRHNGYPLLADFIFTHRYVLFMLPFVLFGAVIIALIVYLTLFFIIYPKIVD